MSKITTLAQFHAEMREFDRTHQPEDHYTRRLREKREEEEKRKAEERKQQACEQQNSQKLVTATIDPRIEQWLFGKGAPLTEVLADVISRERQSRRRAG